MPKQSLSTVYILGLIRQFPCLARKLEACQYRPVEFDPDQFHALMGGWSAGERVCGYFILNVWSYGYAKEQGWTFDFFEFEVSADHASRQAMLNWLAHPHYP